MEINKLFILVSVVLHHEPESTNYCAGYPKRTRNENPSYCADCQNYPKHNYLSYLFSVEEGARSLWK
jgi:hypothetical protein